MAPMSAILSPFLSDGTALTRKITPETGAWAFEYELAEIGGDKADFHPLGLIFPSFSHGFRAIRGFGTYFYLAIIAQYLADLSAYQLAIVRDHNTFAHRDLSGLKV
jgi:hypothetical protein